MVLLYKKFVLQDSVVLSDWHDDLSLICEAKFYPSEKKNIKPDQFDTAMKLTKITTFVFVNFLLIPIENEITFPTWLVVKSLNESRYLHKLRGFLVV